MINLEKTKQSIIGFVLELLAHLIDKDGDVSFLEKGMAVATLVKMCLFLSETLSQEPGEWRSIDVGKDWWILNNHPLIFAVRLDNEVWQVKEGGTTVTYLQSVGKSEILNLNIQTEASDDPDDEDILTHIVHLELLYPNEERSDYLWKLHQYTTRHSPSNTSKQLLAESKDERTFSAEHASFIIFDPFDPEEDKLKTMTFDDFIE